MIDTHTLYYQFNENRSSETITIIYSNHSHARATRHAPRGVIFCKKNGNGNAKNVVCEKKNTEFEVLKVVVNSRLEMVPSAMRLLLVLTNFLLLASIYADLSKHQKNDHSVNPNNTVQVEDDIQRHLRTPHLAGLHIWLSQFSV